jgi:hypothetical protein
MSFDHRAVQRGLRQLRETGYAGLAYVGGRPAYVYSPLRRSSHTRRGAGGTRHGS